MIVKNQRCRRASQSKIKAIKRAHRTPKTAQYQARVTITNPPTIYQSKMPKQSKKRGSRRNQIHQEILKISKDNLPLMIYLISPSLFKRKMLLTRLPLAIALEIIKLLRASTIMQRFQLTRQMKYLKVAGLKM